MKKIGILSDTHGFWDSRFEKFFADCDELWHAGDIGNIETARTIRNFKPLRAVHGNIDGRDVRIEYPEVLRFFCEDVEVMITHIGGNPSRYEPSISKVLRNKPPQLFVCGHSHILRVQFDEKLNLLYVNPGAAGNSGIHHVKTAIRLTIDGDKMKDMEVFELPR